MHFGGGANDVDFDVWTGCRGRKPAEKPCVLQVEESEEVRIEVRDVRTMSLLPIRRTSAMAVSRMVVASSRGRAERSMRTTAVFLAVVASGAGKEPRKATVCVRGSVPGTSVERAEEHVTLLQGRTVAENTLELKLLQAFNVDLHVAVKCGSRIAMIGQRLIAISRTLRTEIR